MGSDPTSRGCCPLGFLRCAEQPSLPRHLLLWPSRLQCSCFSFHCQLSSVWPRTLFCHPKRESVKCCSWPLPVLGTQTLASLSASHQLPLGCSPPIFRCGPAWNTEVHSTTGHPLVSSAAFRALSGLFVFLQDGPWLSPAFSWSRVPPWCQLLLLPAAPLASWLPTQESQCSENVNGVTELTC